MTTAEALLPFDELEDCCTRRMLENEEEQTRSDLLFIGDQSIRCIASRWVQDIGSWSCCVKLAIIKKIRYDNCYKLLKFWQLMAVSTFVIDLWQLLLRFMKRGPELCYKGDRPEKEESRAELGQRSIQISSLLEVINSFKIFHQNGKRKEIK